jgi:hypothetical protein
MVENIAIKAGRAMIIPNHWLSFSIDKLLIYGMVFIT